MTRSFWGGSGYLIPGDAEQGTSTTRQWCSARLCTGNTGNAHGQSTNLGEPNAINLPFGNGSPIHKKFVILGMAYCWVYHILKEP